MLEIESVSWKNFLSYPDSETTVPISTLGQCLITGNVVDDEKSQEVSVKKSNGAGKSTIPSVIQWILFGRTMHSAQPGNKVINWFTKKDCWGKLIFKNGDSITRVRKSSGQTELIYVKNGDENTLVSDTQSTTAIQQKQLAKEFDLDWDILCGSVFMNQYGKPWMEMPDAARKKAIERILHVDKLIYRANIAKSKYVACENKVASLQDQLQSRKNEKERLEREIKRIEEARDNFAGDKKRRQLALLEDVKVAIKKRDSVEIPDKEKLKKSWDKIEEIEQAVSEKEGAINTLELQVRRTQSDLDNAQRVISMWETKSGKTCLECEQEIPHEHIGDKISPYKEKVKNFNEEIASKQEDINSKRSKVVKFKEVLATKKPKTTLAECRLLEREKSGYEAEIQRLKSAILKIKEEENPHNKSLEDAEKRFEECASEIAEKEKSIQRYDYQALHYKYIYKAYNDRKRIKSHIFQKHIPFINNRLKHYLDVFGLDIPIELTDSLSIKSEKWGYDFESGGERKRTDVAFMLAIFDFHEQMYGRQCNMLVLDEVDGKLDDEGINGLISIIKDDLAPKVETILIISHRNMMFDTFPREIKVTRTNRFSQLEIN